MKRAQHLLRLVAHAALRPLNLTTPHYAALSAIAAIPRASNAALARRAFVTPQMMNEIVRGLVSAGLPARRTYPEHGRVIQLYLTPSGEAALEAAHARVQAVEARMLADLQFAHRITATVIPVDLTAPDGPATLYRRTQEAGLAVDVLVNNAGFATHGVFETIAIQRHLEDITLNVSALVEVTHRCITVLTRCPGSTETPFFDVVGAAEASFGRRATPRRSSPHRACRP